MSGINRKIKRAQTKEARITGHRKTALTKRARRKALEQIAEMRRTKTGPFAETTVQPDPNTPDEPTTENPDQ